MFIYRCRPELLRLDEREGVSTADECICMYIHICIYKYL
jgi:hypothetical protein